MRQLYALSINLSTFIIPTWQAAKFMAVPDLVRMNSSSMGMLRRQKGSYLLPVMLLPGRLKGRMTSMVLDIVVCRNKQFLDRRVPLRHFMACLDK